MPQKSLRIFLDTSVIIAAVLSPQGGSRQILLLGEAGFFNLMAGPNVLREAEDVVRRKVPESIPQLVRLLDAAQIITSSPPTREMLELAGTLLDYKPDALVLAEAMAADPDWLISHDTAHFLSNKKTKPLSFRIGTPGDLIQHLKENFLPS